MKTKYLQILFVALLFSLTSCKKEGQSSITGKWQEVKLRIYQLNGTTILYDTTYLHPFTNYDYIQFNDNGTCTEGSDHYYYINAPGFLKTPQAIPPTEINFNYSAYGSVYILSQTPEVINFSGSVTADTVSISGNTLFQHVVDYSPARQANAVYDSYFIRQ
jgi:hypothetical protein